MQREMGQMHMGVGKRGSGGIDSNTAICNNTWDTNASLLSAFDPLGCRSLRDVIHTERGSSALLADA